MNCILRRMLSNPLRCVSCARNRILTVPVTTQPKTFLHTRCSQEHTRNVIARSYLQRVNFSQTVARPKKRIPDELWALLIIGMGGVAVFVFTIYKKKEMAIKKRSLLHMKLAKAKQSLDNGDKEKAYSLLKEVLDMIHEEIAEKQKKEEKKGKPPTHGALRFVLSQSANLASDLQQWDEAEHFFRLTLQEFISSGTRTDDDAFIEVSLNLSKACEQQNKLNLALEGFKWCVKTAETKVNLLDEPSDNSKALQGVCLDALGTFLLTHGHPEQAADVLVRALDVAKEVLGEDNEQTLVVMNNLAKAYAECGKYEQAERVATETIALAEKTECSFIPTFLANLGSILMEEGKIKKAKKAMIKALKLAEDAKDEEAKAMIKDNMMKLDINV